MNPRKENLLNSLGPSGVASFVRGLFPELQAVGKEQALVKCLFHEEQNASMSVQLSTGLYNCKSCRASGDLFSLIQRIHGVDFKGALDILESFAGVAPTATKAATKPREKIKQTVVATFDYHDPEGNLIFKKDRLEPAKYGNRTKEFVYYHEENGNRIYNLNGITDYPYRINTFADAKAIYFPEGEAKADLLVSWGFCASCLKSGSSKWNPLWDKYVAEKHIVVMPDNDETGELYSKELCKALANVAAVVRVLNLPGLPAKGDILDWVKVPGNDRERFIALASEAVPWLAPPSKEVVQQRVKQTKERSRIRRGAEVLIPLLAENPLYKDNTGNCYMLLSGKLYSLDGKSREFFEELFQIYWNEFGQSLNKEAGSATTSYYSGLARLNGEEIELFKRVGLRDGKIYYDLIADNKAVEISPGAWKIVDAPIMFQRLSHHLPQPEPVRGGNPWRVFDFIRVAEGTELLFLVTLITCLIPNINHPALAIGGPQGSGKSTTQSVIKLIIDRASNLLSIMPRKPEDVPLLLSRNHMTAFDNQSGFSHELADLFCAAITGGVIEKRVLHTDSEMMTLRVPGVITYSAITAVTDRPDLHERTVRFTLERLNQEQNISEDRLYKQVSAAVPEILGGIFDVIARAMELQPDVEDTLQRLPRMCDYAIWGYAIGQALDNRGAEFLQLYSGNASLAVHDLLANNTFFSAIVQAMDRPLTPPLQGSFAELIRALQAVADPEGEANGYKSLARDPSFPKSHQKFRGMLERLKVPLNAMGIDYGIQEHKTNKGRMICTFWKIDEKAATVDVNQVLLDDMEVAF